MKEDLAAAAFPIPHDGYSLEDVLEAIADPSEDPEVRFWANRMLSEFDPRMAG